ncbi:septal ring lytic transglycosylase RlpA family protein [Alphaproteobacteria bacterium]|nr:septal ring lytic transglycosylase RlpA family protein [Alphaproteobacteria bacterium]
MRVYLSLFLLLILTACSSPEGVLLAHVAKHIPMPGEAKSEGTFKVGTPYKVKGVWYKPSEQYEFTQTGIASWYGPNFHGKRTANGEIFDQNELTAAHKTLQMPSLIRVTNLGNGRSLVLRVNDRGPFSRGRVLDVSKRGAELLGFKNQGTAKVRIEVLTDESRAVAQAAKQGHDTSGTEIAINERPRDYKVAAANVEPAAGVEEAPPIPTKPQEPRYVFNDRSYVAGHIEQGRFMPDPVVNQEAVAPTNIFVQAGSFANEGNAARLAANLSQINTTTVQTVVVQGKSYHRVRMGPLGDVRQADAILNELSQRGYNGAEIIVD